MNFPRKKALQKASTYKEKPVIPQSISNRFPRWTHFEIRAYHERIIFRNAKGERKKSRNVTGMIFIFLARENGIIHPEPVKKIAFDRMTRREFSSYVRGLTENMDDSLTHIFH